MGQQSSNQSPPVDYTRFVNTLLSPDNWEGFGIDSSLQRFSGLNSNAQLNAYRDQVLYQVELTDIGSPVERLGQAFSGFAAVPHAVGLGALVISLILEIVGKTMKKQTMGTAEMIERVFAQEKAREVRDLMEEYLKCLLVNLRNPQLQLDSGRQIQTDLSVQLTRLKNSMLVDGHMNTRSLKQWVNGAAFHTQILIHEDRLQGADGSRAVQAARLYQQQTNVLLKKYKEYVRNVLQLSRHNIICIEISCSTMQPYCEAVFHESFSPTPKIHEFGDCVYKINKDDLVEALFSDPRITWANAYFSTLEVNIPTLVRQKSDFYIRS